MKSQLLILMLMLVFAGPRPLMATPGELSGLDAFMEQALQASHIPGAALAIVKGQELVLAKGYGVREQGKAAPVDADTLFAIGSNSKHFTATVLGMLVNEGRVDWDAPLINYLPGLRFSDPYLYNEVTLRDALSHRTGVGRADMRWYARPSASRDDVLAMIGSLPQEIGLRSGFLYNNFMFVAAGEVVPAVTGESWDAFLAERIFKPLGMDRSRTTWAELQRQDNLATPHSVIGDQALPIPYLKIDHVGPAGSITSSVNDMARWCKTQLADGKSGDREIIPASVIAEVRKPHTLASLRPDGHMGNQHSAYGLGIGRGNYADKVAYYHTGGIDGMISSFVFIPEAQLCAVSLTNGSPNASLHSAIVGYVLDRMLGLPESDYLEKISGAFEETSEMMRKVAADHAASADTSVKPTLAVDKLLNTYSDEAFGELTISLQDEQLRFAYGDVFVGRLEHHRGDIYDVILDDKVRRLETHMTVSFSASESGEAESILVEILGPESNSTRYVAALRPVADQGE